MRIGEVANAARTEAVPGLGTGSCPAGKPRRTTSPATPPTWDLRP